MADVVKVTYDFVGKTIAVDVLVDVNAKIVVALPVIPPGDGWVMTWNMIGDGAPHFVDEGIVLITTPTGLNALPSPDNGQDGTSRTITFNNQCNSDGQVQYMISGEREGAAWARKYFKREDFLHDPTISVVTDPPTP